MPRSLDFIAQLHMRSDFAELRDLALAVEQANFARIYVPDHFHVQTDDRLGGGIAEAWTTQAALAAVTERVRIGAAVLCNLFRHPCLTAQSVATVDQVSGGRLDFGFGAGWWEHEFSVTGLPFPRPAPRIRMLEESLEIILPALRGETVKFDGEFYHVRDFVLQPACVQRPRPPLLIGGGGDKLLALAARHAEIVSLVPQVPDGDLDPATVRAFDAVRFQERAAWVRTCAERAERDPAEIELLMFAQICVPTESPAETAKTAQAIGEQFGIDERGTREHPMVLIGTPDEMVATLEERRDDWGIGSVMLGDPAPALIEHFAREIIPRVARA